MTLAGHPLVVKGGASANPATEIDGVNTLSYGPSATMLTTVDFKDTTEHMTRMRGLKDGAISFGGDYEPADTATIALKAAHAAGTAFHVQILWDGTNGDEVQTIVESFSIESDTEGKVTFSASMLFNAAPIVRP